MTGSSLTTPLLPVHARRCPACATPVQPQETRVCAGCLARHHPACFGAACGACGEACALEPRPKPRVEPPLQALRRASLEPVHEDPTQLWRRLRLIAFLFSLPALLLLPLFAMACGAVLLRAL